MILHKENTARAKPLYQSLFDIAENERGTHITDYNSNELKLLEKYSYFIQNLISFEEEIKNDSNVKILMARFLKYLKGIIPVKEISLLFYNELNKKLISIDEDETKLSKTMNHFNNEGIFKILFEKKKSLTIPELESYNDSGSKLYYFVIPVFDNTKKYGVLSILTSLDTNKITELERKSIDVFLNLVLGKLEKLKLSEKLNSTYEELQTYQAKLSNDFRLSAIGEMTEGIVEDLANPLQVISSNIDILNAEVDDNIEIQQIKSQIKKIKNVIGRLVKFADVNQKDVTIQPCNINNIIKDYFQLVKSTLENANMEYILDIEKELPSVLSHPNYIYQLLTNVFTLIKNYNKQKGGVIIQTRFNEDCIVLRVISTSKISKPESGHNSDARINISLSIIKNLIEKHEGTFELESFENSGSAFVLSFPLKRKIRK